MAGDLLGYQPSEIEELIDSNAALGNAPPTLPGSQV